MKKKYIFQFFCIALFLLLSGNTFARSLNARTSPTSPIHNLQFKVVSFFVELIGNNKIFSKPEINAEINSAFAIISCPGNISVNNDPGICDAIVNYAQPTTDIIGGSMEQIDVTGYTSGDAFPLGNTIQTWEESDALGNATGELCSFTVTVNDNEAPVITLTGANPQILEACSAYVELGASVSDCESGLTATINASAVNMNIPGNYTVTYNVTDTATNAATQVTRTVTVQDTTKPVITLNGAASITLEACTDTYTELGANATDNCSVGAVTIGGDTVNVNAPATYTLTYDVTDANGVAADQVTRTVIVQDTTKPVITLNGAASITLEACTDTYTELGANATDNCSVGAVTIGGDTVNVNAPATYTLTYDVTDANGVAADQVTRTVIVQDTTKPVITLNGAASITLEACTDTYTELGANATDNCSVGAVTIGGDTVNVNAPATYTLTYDVTDANGVAADQVTRTVIVQDTTKPVITLNGAASITLEACTDTYTELGANATDNCSVGAVTIGGDTVNVNAPATYTLTYDVTDANGVAADQVTRTVIVQDTTKPVITLNGAASITLEACTDTYTELGANATDNCSVGAVTIGGDTVNVNAPATYTLTYDVTDANGVAADQVTRTVIVQDTTKPVITLNGAASITLEACTDTYTELGANATDNCSVGAVTIGGDTVNVNAPATYTLTYDVTDANGVAADQVTRTVIVQDTTKPVITLNGAASITLEACTDTYTELGANATDNCSVGAVTIGGDTVNVNAPATYTLTYDVTDANGVAADQVTRTVIVQDTTKPVITLNGAASITLEACTDTYTELGANATDNCSVGAVTIGGDTVNVNAPATYTLTYDVTDANGVAADQVTRTVIVQDTTKPVITLNGAASITLEACTDTYTELGANATDNCSVGAVTIGGDTVNVNAPATYTLTYDVTDANGVAADQVTRTVIVQDTTKPVITLNGAASITLEACTDTYTELGANATDNCSVGAVTIGGDTVNVNAPATYTLTYDVTDANGVAADQVTRTVIVQDTTKPVITLNGAASITLEACTDTYTELGANATDNCSVGAVTIGGDTVNVNAPATYTLTYDVTDANGVAADQVTRTVIVQDTTKPVITLNGAASITLEACTDTYTELGANATDNCSVGAVTIGGDTVNVNAPATYTLTYDVTDANGVAADQVTRTVIVQDTTKPVITLNGAASITLEACTDTYTELGANATDNCSVGAVTIGGDTVNVNAPATYTLTYDVTDANGVAADQVTRTVIVQDTTKPVITLNGAASITLEACTDTYTELGANATDNCSVGAVTIGGDTVNVNAPATYTLTYDVTDANGVAADQVTRTVIVQDTTPPTISCTSNIIVNNTPNTCGAVVTYTTPVGADNCPGATTTRIAGPASGATFPVGVTTVTYRVTDTAGLTADCSFNVNVADNEIPTISCPSNIVVNNTPNTCGAAVTYTAPVGADNCSGATTTRIAGPASGATFPVGVTTVTHRVTDASGNVAQCSFTVTVIDNQPPVALCKNVTIALDANGEIRTNRRLKTSDINNGSSDNCSVSLSFGNGFNGEFNCTDIGVNVITLVATDPSGNTSSCTANVTVIDNIPPTAICRATPLTVQLNASGTATVLPSQINNGSNDGANPCGVTLSLSQSTFDCTNIGSNTVTLTATDGGGNTATCNTTVIVQDNVQPTTVCQPFTVYLDNNGNGTLTVDDIDGGSTDACGIVSRVASKTTFNCSDLGTRTVRLTVTDTNGNSSICDASVTIVDNIAPIAPALTNITWGCDYTPTTPTTTDNCTGGAISGVPDTTFPITTTTTITWTFTDNAGNSSTATQTITINPMSCSATQTKAVSCFGGADGEATVNVTGGIGPYTYLWSNGQTTANATGLTAGSHSVTVTDSNGCSTNCSVTITEPNQLISSITSQSTALFCFDSPQGSVTVAGAGGVSPYTYRIDGGAFQGSGTFNNLIGGAHTVTVQDANGCTVDQAVNLAGPTEELVADVQITVADCFEPGSKAVVVVGQGGNGGYQYKMNNTGPWLNDGDFGGLVNGTYTFQVRDSENCLSDVVTVNINESTRVQVTIPNWVDVLCYGDNTGSATPVVSHGKAPYTYSWSNGQTTPDATGLAAGTYTLTVTDFYDCQATASVTITEPDEIILSETHVNVTCYNGTNGSISLSATGGVGPYQYSKNGGAYTLSNVFSNLTDGTYTMGVIDDNGCEHDIDVIITEPTQITATFTTNTVGCANTNSGTATVTPSGGTPGYTYSWNTSPVQTTQTASGLSPGTYTVTITDAAGCSRPISVTYSDPAILDVNLTTTVTSGPGQTDGTASANPSGGVGPYTYLWTTSDGSGLNPTAQNQTGLSQGTYTVTVTDSKGCQKTKSVIVADIITIALEYETACDPNESIDLQHLFIRLLDVNGNPLITGGYGNLTYSWTFGASGTTTSNLNDNSTKEITYLTGGDRTIILIVADDSGQSVSYSFMVTIDSCIEFDVDCERCVSQDYQLLDWFIGDEFGNSINTCETPGEVINDSIYIWFYLDHGDNTNYNLNVVAEYQTIHPLTGEVTIEAVEECLYEGVPIGLGLAYLFIDDNYVCGSEINITNFLISWTKLAKTPCGQREPKCYCPGFDIGVSSPLAAIATGTDLSCYAGTNNGTATVTPYGGTPPYTYFWSTSDGSGLVPTAQNQTGLSPGTYTVTVTDSNTKYDEDTEMTVPDPYSVTTTVVIGEPEELSIVSFDPNVPPCHGGSNGYAQVNVTGGTPPYTYSWSNGQTTQTATNLSAGTYTVTVTDANGCTDSDTVTIIDPLLLTSTASSTQPSCFGSNDGTATVTPSGGTPGYTYLWSDGQTLQTATGLVAGSYSVTVTDANNCTTSANVTIGQPTVLEASTSKINVTCFGAANGTATISVTGGTAPYSYLWGNGQTTATATGLAPGTINVVATDANGCQISRNVSITQPTDLSLSTEFNEPNCYNGANGGTAKIYPSGGIAPYSYLWSDGQTTQTAINLAEGTYTVTVTDANGCTENASITVTLPLETFANAGVDQSLSCGVTSTVLNASGIDSEGYTMPGNWYIISGTGGSFSAVTDPNAIFTGQPNTTYQLLWEIDCAQDAVTITFDDVCSTLDFDGDNDHVTFQNHYDLSGNFSFEIWIKPDANQNDGGANNAIQTILSKRDATNLSHGYDLRLEGSTLSFNLNNSTVVTASPISTSRWHHVAVTYNGTYTLYVDGLEINSGGSGVPSGNTNEFMLGAMDQAAAGGNPNPVNYYSGWMQELRIWDVALTTEQIRQMMNQHIHSNGLVQGDIVPIDVAGLNWASLRAYYQMLQPGAINSGYLLPTGGSAAFDGKLVNIETVQQETAPLPYTTIQNGNWNDTSGSSPWTYGSTVWDYPNSTGITGADIEWNIVRTLHDVTSDTQDVTLLGLLVDANELTITNSAGAQNETNIGHGLNITHYLLLNGFIDLVGESQLVQKRYTPSQVSESLFDTASTGRLERDQQGQSILFNYNYWSSPVTTSIGAPYNVSSILKDGTNSNNPLPLQWTDSYNADPDTSGKTISRRWVWAYENNLANTYGEWRYIQESGTINPGISFTMKGSGATGSEQNYVFDGKPNNATISTTVTVGNEALIGNPYPSAIDANEFIKDNIPTLNPDGSVSEANAGTSGSIDGTLYFWIHYSSNVTHVLRDYQGGYAQYNLSGGNLAVTPPPTTDGAVISGIGSSGLRPNRYIPVAQGFFVNAALGGSGPGSQLTNQVRFHNSQRIFRTEQADPSVFLKSGNSKKEKPPTPTHLDDNEMKRMRFQFKTPEGANRHLLLAFTPNNEATDGFDYGYDAINTEVLPNDMLFTIEDKNYIIQGVGKFEETKQFPIGIFTTTGGPIEISLFETENIVPGTKVYIYDSLLGTYTEINDKNQKFEITLDAGDHLDRFFITFLKNNALSDEEVYLSDNVTVNYLNDTHEIHIKTPNDLNIKQVYLTNMLGQTIKSWNISNTPSLSSDMKIPVKRVSEGSYIVKVQTSKGFINKKVLIMQ